MLLTRLLFDHHCVSTKIFTMWYILLMFVLINIVLYCFVNWSVAIFSISSYDMYTLIPLVCEIFVVFVSKLLRRIVYNIDRIFFEIYANINQHFRRFLWNKKYSHILWKRKKIRGNRNWDKRLDKNLIKWKNLPLTKNQADILWNARRC